MTAGNSPRRRRPWVPQVPDAFQVPDLPAQEALPDASPDVTVTSAPSTPAGETATGTSRDGTVEAQVDLHGHLRHLRIDPAALRGPHPQHVARAIVEAMNVARGQALRLARAATERTRKRG